MHKSLHAEIAGVYLQNHGRALGNRFGIVTHIRPIGGTDLDQRSATLA